MPTYYLAINSPIGKLTIAAKDGFVTSIYFEDEEPKEINSNGSKFVDIPITITDKEVEVAEKNADTDVLNLAANQLQEYFAGNRKKFNIPLRPEGGSFFQKVWSKMLEEVAYGKTISYSELGMLVGSPKGARAVGMANGKNPIPIIIPCHRVIGKSGKLTGFRGGIDAKKILLALEGILHN